MKIGMRFLLVASVSTALSVADVGCMSLAASPVVLDLRDFDVFEFQADITYPEEFLFEGKRVVSATIEHQGSQYQFVALVLPPEGGQPVSLAARDLSPAEVEETLSVFSSVEFVSGRPSPLIILNPGHSAYVYRLEWEGVDEQTADLDPNLDMRPSGSVTRQITSLIEQFAAQ